MSRNETDEVHVHVKKRNRRSSCPCQEMKQRKFMSMSRNEIEEVHVHVKK